ncbi:dihydrodipicolinate reductase [Candidatus Bipolaricaulota bacterium]|nr:dihydrodipicolinate reductase [Candidatus Bipolaricaulota bacterium]
MKKKVVQYGVGEIGKEIARLVVTRNNYELIGAVDLDKKKVGKDIGEILGMDRGVGVKVTDDSDKILSKNPDFIFHSTGSHMVNMEDQLIECIGTGANVISTTEELSFPFLQSPEIAENLNKVAEKEGSTILGTGVNPGFVMDMLPVVATGVARKVNKISVLRIQNASERRKPLQAKIGSGLSKKEFDEQVTKGGGHIGLIESIALIGYGLGWELEEIDQAIEPVIAKEKTESEYFKVEKGEALGIQHTGYGKRNGKKVIDLDLRMYLGAENPRDVVEVDGNPSFDMEIKGGLHGDIATPAVVINSAPSVNEASPGLKTVLDLPPPAFHE